MSGLYGAIPIGLNVNQLGASSDPRTAITQPSPYYSALVEDVILNEEHPNYNDAGSTCGDVRVRFLPQDRNVPTDRLNWASPIDSSIEDYPLKNETVLVYFALGRLFYTRRINSTKKAGESTWPGLGPSMGARISDATRSANMVLAAEGLDTYSVDGGASDRVVEEVPVQNPTAFRLRACTGDTILYGRYGNTIRMGSNLFTQNEEESQFPEPNIIITAGASTPAEVSTDVKNAPRTPYSTMYENINEDKSAIWLVANQNVKFVPITAKNNAACSSLSSIDKTEKYDGAQIFINSDRVILNSKRNEIALFSNNEINLSAMKTITLDTETSVIMTANKQITLDAGSSGSIFVQGNNISLTSTKDMANYTEGNYSIVGRNIFIGSSNDTTQPLVLGTRLAVFLQKLIIALQVNLPASFVPSPAGATALTALSTALIELQTDIANPLLASFNSKSNFTTERNTV